MKIRLVFLGFVILLLSAGCGLNRSEHDKMRAIRDDYLVQLAEIRQANETMNRNIISAYQELASLEARLEQHYQDYRTRSAN